MGFFDDLEALGQAAKGLLGTALENTEGYADTAAPSLYFSCVCSRRWSFPLVDSQPAAVLQWIANHLQECPRARAWLDSNRQLGPG